MTSLLSAEHRLVLSALVDHIVPADEWPSATASGALEYLETHADDELKGWWPTLVAGVAALDGEAQRRWGNGFARLTTGQGEALLADVAGGSLPGPTGAATTEFFNYLVTLVSEAFYADPVHGANSEAASWQMVGYPSPPSPTKPGRLPGTTSSVDQVKDRYDVVVVGGGAGGGVAAYVLAGAGLDVLVVERGDACQAQDIPADHVRNQRLSRLGLNAGPPLAGNPRVLDPGDDGPARVVAPNEAGWHNNAMTLGGGTRVWGAQAWRMAPTDFRMASTYGVPDGSTLADWPVSYDELEPYYDLAEWALGVAGEAGHTQMGPRQRGYPMAPFPLGPTGQRLAGGAKRLGWTTAAVPLMLNTVPYGGRDACVRCSQCIAFACPVDAKTGSHNSVLADAVELYRCTVLVGARVISLTRDANGQASGVILRSENNDGTARQIRAGAVVLAAGAIETARLLLISGMGGPTVGHNLQGHTYVGAFGLYDEIVGDALGPGPEIATCQFLHGNDGVIGGGILHSEFVKLPAIFWHSALPPGTPRWGAPSKAAMRDGYLRTIHVAGPIQEVPTASARVELDASVKDHLGLPVARLSGRTHPADAAGLALLSQKAQEWMEASGAARVWPYPQLPLRPALSGGQHQAGTCRMGADPGTSVCDPNGALHDVPNVVVADGSVHVTNGGVNPTLTLMALAWRSTEALAARL